MKCEFNHPKKQKKQDPSLELFWPRTRRQVGFVRLSFNDKIYVSTKSLNLFIRNPPTPTPPKKGFVHI